MLVIKIIIGVTIVCITGYIGIEMSNMLKAREEILTEYITFVTLVKNEMIYMRDTLPHAFEISRQKLKTNLIFLRVVFILALKTMPFYLP